jgi:hypothetical protein
MADGRVTYSDPWRDRSPQQVLWDEKRREDEWRSLGIRVVRVAEADLGPRGASVQARPRELVAAPDPGRPQGVDRDLKAAKEAPREEGSTPRRGGRVTRK